MRALIAFLVSLLTGMGVGGGGLLVLYLSLGLQMEQRAAQSLNLLFFILSSLASLPVHLKKRRIDYRAVGFLLAGGLLGAVGGAYLTSILDAETVKEVFGGFLMLSGGVVLFRKQEQKKEKA